MKILLLGGTGLIGKALFREGHEKYELITPSHDECDITNLIAVRDYIDHCKPEAVINAAGYTKVDKAEDEKDKAFEINAIGVANIVSAIVDKNTPLVHFSTDYIFEGTKKAGYTETDSPFPLSVYGSSKALAEAEILRRMKKYFLVRTAWIYGEGGTNFVDTMLGMAERGEDIKVVHDQVGTPTYAADVAQAVFGLLNTKNYGIYHIVNGGCASWYEFAVEIFHQLGIPQKITPITSQELKRKAKRPQYSILRNAKLPPLRSWKEALGAYLMNKTLIV